MSCLGIEIGGTKLQIVRGDEAGQIIERRRFEVDRAKGAEGIRQQISECLRELLRGKQIKKTGVGFGGPVDWRRGVVSRSHHIEGWNDFDLIGWLRDLTGTEVRVDNDANVAALAEARRGAGRGYNPVFYVTLGSGVGGGLVVDGRIYHGAVPGECEIGHIRLSRGGDTVESRCSGWAIDRRIRALRTAEPNSALVRLAAGENSQSDSGKTSNTEHRTSNIECGENVASFDVQRSMFGVRCSEGEHGEAKFLSAALALDDSAAKRILRELAADLSLGLSHVAHLFHPEVIVLGGGLSKIGEPLRASVERELHGLIMEGFAPGPRVALSELGEDAVPLGALELLRDSGVPIGTA